jgi:Ni,Fe-hydrogenase III large subunit
MGNGSSIPIDAVPVLEVDGFMAEVADAIEGGRRVTAYFAADAGDGATALYAVVASKAEGTLGVLSTRVGASFPSLAARFPQLSLFEREIAEQFGVVPEGHPWMKPVRFHRSWVPGRDAFGRGADDPIEVGVMDYYRVEGEEVHEVAVGPVHAGIIEPGHFRFQCHGEHVFHLEISLGYQHRDIERQAIGGPHPHTIHRMETCAGDTTIGHAQAYCMAVEALSGCAPPARAEALRAVALELERLANHAGDLGAIAGDVGYLPTASFCGRIRGDILNMSAGLCGSRFGRGLVRPGGVVFDCGPELTESLRRRVGEVRADLTNAVSLLWNTSSVMARLENTGNVDAEFARELGLVGPAARACGLNRDVRRDHPFGFYRMTQIPVVTAHHGDVCSRTMVRWMECERSLDFVDEVLGQLPAGPVRRQAGAPGANRLAVAMTEGWRGEVCHVALTDAAGRFSRYKVVDPSFHNWTGLAMALRGQQISDFPLCNKSFNLSYCGFDL